MRSTILLLGLCALASLTHGYGMQSVQRMQRESSDSWPPAFCKNLQCPHFTVVKTTDDYTVRKYDASKWAKTSLTGQSDYKSAQRTMFYRLFDYIQGQNAEKKKIEMTIPVLIGMIPKSDDTVEANFNMSFYMAIDDLPAPTNKDVSLYDLPEVTVYVRKFGGYASETDYVQQAKKLRAALPEGTQYDDSYFYSLSYDSPWTIFNRRNEVWYMGL